MNSMLSLIKTSAPAGDRPATRVLSDPDAAPGFRDSWRALAEERGTPFLTPEWFDAWTTVAGRGCSGSIVAVERRGELIGVLPLVVERGRTGSALRFAGASFGDCFHPLSAPGDEELVALAAGHALRARRWSSIELAKGLLGSGWQEVLIDASAATGSRITHESDRLPYVDFAGRDWDGFLAAKSRNFRKGLWRSMRRLGERGEVGLRISEDRRLDGDMERFIELHDMRWGSGSAFLTPDSVAFHTAFARASLERGWLRLGNLELDGRTIASTYGWRVGDRFSEFQRGYDTGLVKLAPGKLVMGEMMRALNEEGARIYDQLLGDEDYKMQVADGTRQVQTIHAARRGSLRSGRLRAEQLARRAYRRLPAEARDVVRARIRASRRMPA